MFFKLLHSQKGMALIQGLFLAASIAGIAYVGSKLSYDQKLIQKTAESRDAVEQLHNLIYNILQNQEHCTATMNTVGFTLGGEVRLSKIITHDGVTAFEVNNSTTYDASKMYMQNKVSIQDIKVQFGSSLAIPSKIEINYQRLEKDNAARKSGAGYGGSSITKSHSFLVQQDQKGVFHCYAIQKENKDLAQTFCEEVDLDNDPSTNDSFFIWDPDNNLCRLKDLSCPPGKVNAGLDDQGKPGCYDIIEWMDIYDILDNTNPMECADSAQVEFEIVGGEKVRLKCEAPCVPQNGTLSDWTYDTCTGATTIRRKTCATSPSCRGTPCPPDETETVTCPGYVPPIASTTTGGTSSGGGTSTGTSTTGAPPSCVPAQPCAGLTSVICSDKSAGSDSCGTSCGMGVKNCACTPSTSCSTLQASICTGIDAGKDSCGNSCGNGTRTLGCAPKCFPAAPCSTLMANTCMGQPVVDSCGTSCGPGSKKVGCVKCYATWCHLAEIRTETCYWDGSKSDLKSAGIDTCSDKIEDGGGTPCNNPVLCPLF